MYDLLVDGDGWQLDQPVRGDHWSITGILQSEGQPLFWKTTYIKNILISLLKLFLCNFSKRIWFRSEPTFSSGDLHFVWSKSTAISLFSVVADSSGVEQEGAGLCLHAIVSEDSGHLKVRAHDHVVSQFDLKWEWLNDLFNLIHGQ